VPVPTPTAEPTPEPTISPSPTPRIPIFEIGFLRVGTEDPAGEGSRPQVVRFRSEGPQTVRVDAVGRDGAAVTICLQQRDDEPVCQTGGDVFVTIDTERQGSRWTLTLEGATDGTIADADVSLRFRTSEPALSLEGFRLSGVSATNGLRLAFTARGNGTLGFTATLDAEATWTLAVNAGETPVHTDSQTGTSVSADVPVERRQAYTLELTGEPTEPGAEVHLEADITLPEGTTLRRPGRCAARAAPRRRASSPMRPRTRAAAAGAPGSSRT
jgi:hypothetical protein